MTHRKKVFYEVLAFGFILLFLIVVLTPSAREFKVNPPKYTSLMFERTDETQKISYIYVPDNKISKYLLRAVVVAEDGTFFEHKGFDFESIQKAFEEAWKKKKFPRGASTITQQLAKNLYLSSHKSFFRKIKEALITIKIEQTLSKRKILEIYCNIAEWGPGIFGVEAASRYYFKKSASQLSQYESSILAAMLPGPNGVFDFKKHQNRVMKRAQKIMGKL